MSEPQAPMPDMPMVSPLVTAERRPSKPQRWSGRRPTRSARSARRPSSPSGGSARPRWRGASCAPRSGMGGIEVVRAAPVDAVRRARVERRVLAEVLHPAVVAVADRLAEQAAVERAARRRGEVELADEERLEPGVAVDVGLAERVLGQRAAAPPPPRSAGASVQIIGLK